MRCAAVFLSIIVPQCNCAISPLESKTRIRLLSETTRKHIAMN